MATFPTTLATILYIIIAALCMYGALDAVQKTDEYRELDSNKHVVVYAAVVAFGILWIVSVPAIMYIWHGSDGEGGAK